MNGDNGTSTPHNQQLRALLFTDLCDSLLLVERIGDVAAAELFQEHDRLVLALQQRWHGQLIDRSDGLFMLFERPIDALGFALDYQRGLQPLGQARDLRLQARAGLHVGEVILWNNSSESIALGAKAVEVEGLAKPMAARLMQLAPPGQLLMSAAAESVVRRAATELGELGGRLQWRSFGRWRFRGVAQPMEVLGVAVAGKGMLSRPRASDKARPDVPVWRRPLAMAAQAALIVSVGLGLWLLARPQPAIAFAERDWVVMADARNLTDNPVLDDALNQALRIGLEQSRYVNVISDMKARDTMARMLMPENTEIDRAAAVQIAMRDGARAVLDPSIREVHGQLRVAVDVVNPATGETVYSVYSDGKGLPSALTSSDQVVVQLRSRLGEAMAQIGKTSAPLPQVATANLDALHAYARGQLAYGRGQTESSLKFFQIATRIDPDFAMAYVGQMRSMFSQGQLEDARGLLTKVRTLRHRLSTREGLYLDAWQVELESGSESAAGEAWKVLADLYPDHHGASVNHGLAEFVLGHYEKAEQAVAHANVEQNPLRSVTLELLGRIQLARGKVDEAVATLHRAMQLAEGRPNRQLVAALAVSGRNAEASAVLARLPENGPGRWLEGTSLAIDEGRFEEALAASVASAGRCNGGPFVCDLLGTVNLAVHAAAARCVAPRDFATQASALLRNAARPENGERGQYLYFAAASLYAAQRLGLQSSIGRQVAELDVLAADAVDPRARQLAAVVKANALHLSGDSAQAIKMLQAMVDGSELFQVHSVLAAAYAAQGAIQEQQSQLDWMRRHRGRAYTEFAGSSVLQALNVGDSQRGPSRPGCALSPDAS
ncbi:MULTISPECIES: putative peptide modification system cyclase [Stenotrophomonas]|uniref:putative peptide modification system cyclase n=1 Tax=Stenotrophomonas TaxID=40323 RepID=UPI00066D5AEF|nr:MULTISPECIES: putative peptide modification system cyclase [Stenotrophomonas]MBD3742411.1 putative peptide modification system cyclase [Stenotrophomonas sp.]MBN5089553.1 putative peptide modification system cyclase [Stenotrophomonas maltophilia]RRU77946.1 putative peptide modification system cyclase [Stenotrophomonas maltophilia]HEL5028985.1 putative peptide modification system cyclase [Stenotrophomonas maltophilia]